MSEREQLIEKAAKALYLSQWHDGDYERTPEFKKNAWRAHARAALAVFEQAHTPTDDEREALIDLIRDWAELHEPVRTDVAALRADVILRFFANRRTVQGEPTDAQADAAQKAFHEFTFGPDDGFLTPRRMGVTRQAWKVALRAAFNETGENRA